MNHVQVLRDGTVTLAEGRVVGFAQAGPEDGLPTVYCHGWPGCRREIMVAPSDPLRMIALDRPGYGLSDVHRTRTLLSFADDTAAVLDYLGVKECAVIGVSGGGPYACAIAHRLGPRVRAMALVNPLAPPESDWHGDSPAGDLIRAGRGPRSVRWIMGAGLRMILRNSPIWLVQWMLRAKLEPGTADYRLRKGFEGEALVISWREALRRSSKGLRSDARLYAQPWGFTLDQIQTPTVVWHGMLDREVPSRAAHTLIQGIPNAIGRAVPGGGHMSVPVQWHREIIADLVAMTTDKPLQPAPAGVTV